MDIADLNKSINHWIAALNDYNIDRLTASPALHSWSIGQLYMHLIEDTNFYLQQIDICVKAQQNSSGEMTAAGRLMFNDNALPAERIKGAPSNNSIPQPPGREYLVTQLNRIKIAFNDQAAILSNTNSKGKALHPGLGYLDAKEWMQFADMHFRHHLRQKKSLDEFLLESGR